MKSQNKNRFFLRCFQDFTIIGKKFRFILKIHIPNESAVIRFPLGNLLFICEHPKGSLNIKGQYKCESEKTIKLKTVKILIVILYSK